MQAAAAAAAGVFYRAYARLDDVGKYCFGVSLPENYGTLIGTTPLLLYSYR